MGLKSLGYQEAQRDLALALIEVGAVRAPQAPLEATCPPIFLNFRVLEKPEYRTITEGIVDLSARCMRSIQLDEDLTFDAVVGGSQSGDPFARDLAKFTAKKFISVNTPEEKGEKRVAALRGLLPKGMKVLIVDDLIGKDDSKYETIEILHSGFVKVTNVIVFVDQERGGREKLLELGCELHAVFTVSELAQLIH